MDEIREVLLILKNNGIHNPSDLIKHFEKHSQFRKNAKCVYRNNRKLKKLYNYLGEDKYRAITKGEIK